MIWLNSANIGIIVTSWWGKNSHEDRMTRYVLDAARDHRIQVAFHIKKYFVKDLSFIGKITLLFLQPINSGVIFTLLFAQIQNRQILMATSALFLP